MLNLDQIESGCWLLRSKGSAQRVVVRPELEMLALLVDPPAGEQAKDWRWLAAVCQRRVARRAVGAGKVYHAAGMSNCIH